MKPYRYIGTDGKLGLSKGVVYVLELASDTNLSGRIWASQWSADRTLRFWKCHYSNYEEFKENWEIVE